MNFKANNEAMHQLFVFVFVFVFNYSLFIIHCFISTLSLYALNQTLYPAELTGHLKAQRSIPHLR